MQTLFVIAIILGFYCLSVALCLVLGRFINKKRFIPDWEYFFFVNFLPFVNLLIYSIMMIVFSLSSFFDLLGKVVNIDKMMEKLDRFFRGN